MASDATQPEPNPDDKARSTTPDNSEFLAYMGSNWGETEKQLSVNPAAAKSAANHRERVAKKFADRVIVVPAGAMKVRSNDTEYRYRPHAAFTQLTGWGSSTVADSVLVIHDSKSVLYFRPTADRTTKEYFSDYMIGEFWVGPRPSLTEVAEQLQLETKPLDDLAADLAKHPIDQLLELPASDELAEFLSEQRLTKDAYEVGEMRKAVAATSRGFDAMIGQLKVATEIERGERLLEGTFFTNARLHGYDLGYESIVAAGGHACILHWTRNDGAVREGDLILIDAGVELESGFTADITRTLPVNGKFSPVQRKIYQAVLEAADAVFAIARPGIKFHELHETAMGVIAEKVAEWGLLPISVEESLQPEKQFHRRWMVHGTSHHLGLDVHDCAEARREHYRDGTLEPGMVFTIEPGLYFHENDLSVPAEYRGIGVRIEDDVLVTENGVENLSAAIPRTLDEVEAWVARLR